ncbi:hypothetical protein R1flu_026758 [Riccia fluitans]|uniref:Uncharacterized protein n=1 Tax=Riccia fluitans TaxID=41844 RepID=A0ABD1XHD1_9MARC
MSQTTWGIQSMTDVDRSRKDKVMNPELAIRPPPQADKTLDSTLANKSLPADVTLRERAALSHPRLGSVPDRRPAASPIPSRLNPKAAATVD